MCQWFAFFLAGFVFGFAARFVRRFWLLAGVFFHLSFHSILIYGINHCLCGAGSFSIDKVVSAMIYVIIVSRVSCSHFVKIVKL